MTEITKTKSSQLTDAYKDLLQVLKGIAGNELKEKLFNIQAEVNFINYKVYGGNQYIRAVGNDENPIQLIVPVEIAKTLQPKHFYEFQGSFEVSNSPDFGFFQFRVSDAQLLGKDMKMEAKKQVANEIIEKGYLDKYKDDFTRFRGKSQCKVALVTSQQSQVVKDVIEVFKGRKGITHELIHVKLNDAQMIADGISSVSLGSYDVIMVIRGGGNESDFAVFNDPCIVKAIHDSNIPVIVGIGHTDNNTFADKAADRSETTPTKAARFLVDMLGEPLQASGQVKSYSQYKKPYNNNRGDWKTFGKAEAGSAATRFALLFLLIAIGAGFIFFVMPLVFKHILNGLG